MQKYKDLAQHKKKKPRPRAIPIASSPVYTRPEAAGFLKISISQLDIMHRKGIGPQPTFIGSRRQYLHDALLDFLTRNTKKAADGARVSL